MNSKQN
jgi:serine/threonine protein kinase